MNGFERINAALHGDWPDKVPVMLHNFLPAAAEAGLSQRQYRENPESIATAFVRAVEKYRYDGIVVDIDTTVLAGAVGVPVDFPEDEPARLRGPLLDQLEDVTHLERINIEDYPYVRVWLEAVMRLVERFRGEVFVRGNCDQAPFSLAGMVRGLENWMMDLLDEEHEELVHRLLEYCTDVTTQFIARMGQTGAHMLSNGDSLAGPSMISPAFYTRYALPYEKRVVAAAHEQGLPYGLHICGDTTPILDGMVDSGTDAVELDYKTDIEAAHRAFRDRVTFIGNIDPSGVINFGTAEDVQRRTEDLLRIYSDTPRFILNAGCAIPRSAPSENIHALVQTARAAR